MKKYEVCFRPLAAADLIGLYEYIAEQAGTAVAGPYIDPIEASCLSLATFPERDYRQSASNVVPR